MVSLVITEARRGILGGTEEGAPNCARDSGRVPRGLGTRAGVTGGNGATVWPRPGGHGKVLSSPGCDEGEGLEVGQ